MRKVIRDAPPGDLFKMLSGPPHGSTIGLIHQIRVQNHTGEPLRVNCRIEEPGGKLVFEIFKPFEKMEDGGIIKPT